MLLCQLSNSEMPHVLMSGGLAVVFLLMSELKMKMKHGGFVCAALDQCSGSFNRQSLDRRLLFYLGILFHFSF